MPQLLVLEGVLAGQTLNLPESAVLGRSFDAEIRLDDPTVSRLHCRICLREGEYQIEDLSSGNGTFLNEQELRGPAPLKAGDVIRISRNRFRFLSSAPAAGVAAAESAIMQTLDVKATLVAAPPVEPAALKKANERLRTILEVSNALQAHLEMDRLLDEVLASLFRVFPQAERGFVMLGDSPAAMTPAASRQRGREKPEPVKLSRHILDEVTGKRLAVLSADAMSDNRFSAAMSIVNFQIRSMICAPLICNDEMLGVIQLDTTSQGKRFTSEDLELLVGVANQVALAVSNAAMHHRLLQRQKLERDLEVARQVQASFLPKRMPEVPGLEFAASYKAALEIGGDFYDFVPMSGGRMGVVLGDVAGKGMSAALLMARVSSDARTFALSAQEPREAVGRVNEKLCMDNPDGSFVTMVLLALDPVKRVCCLVNAAHPQPLVRKKSGRVIELGQPANFAIGAVEGAEFEQEECQLAAGDIICLFSDGITEARNVKGEIYGLERLRQAMTAKSASSAALVEAILKDVHSFVGDREQSDDLTIVCVSIS